MAIFTGEVIDNANAEFPFMAVISDERGNIVGEIPVRTIADGETKIVEKLRDFESTVRAEAESKAKSG